MKYTLDDFENSQRFDPDLFEKWQKALDKDKIKLILAFVITIPLTLIFIVMWIKVPVSTKNNWFMYMVSVAVVSPFMNFLFKWASKESEKYQGELGITDEEITTAKKRVKARKNNGGV